MVFFFIFYWHIKFSLEITITTINNFFLKILDVCTVQLTDQKVVFMTNGKHRPKASSSFVGIKIHGWFGNSAGIYIYIYNLFFLVFQLINYDGGIIIMREG